MSESKRSGWSRTRALLVVVASLWLPATLPFFLGPLTECGHCVRNYLGLLPVLPGLIVGMFVDGTGGILLSGLVTILVVVLLVGVVRRGGWTAWLAVLAVAVLSGALAVGLSYGLRM